MIRLRDLRYNQPGKGWETFGRIQLSVTFLVEPRKFTVAQLLVVIQAPYVVVDDHIRTLRS